MATWWCCCLNYSRIYELVDTQGRISGEQEKRFNDQLSKMNNFPGLTVWMWESADRDWRGFFVKRLQTGFLRSRDKTAACSQGTTPLSSLQFHPISCTLTCGHEYAKHLLEFWMAPLPLKKLQIPIYDMNRRLTWGTEEVILEECFAFIRRLK